MHSIHYRSALPGESLQSFLAHVAALISKRKVRPVVTPSGKRARGNFPSIKAPELARYESLLEQDVLRVAEVSSKVKIIRTHPAVLALPGGKLMHCTPDAQLEWSTGGILVETKATYFLSKERTRTTLQELIKRLSKNGIGLVLIVEHDVQIPSLQDELKDLLRERPLVGKYRASIDPTRWDPLGRTALDLTLERRWRDAQIECDALLERVMRRDPGELFSTATR